MTVDQLDDKDVALMCDIGRDGAGNIDVSRRPQLEALMARGLVERDPDSSGQRFRLTEKAEELLAQRGVGMNEA